MQISLLIPQGAKIFVEENQKVKDGQPLFSSEEKGEVVECDLSAIQGGSPADLRHHLLCSLGSKIHKDQILAESRSLFGLKTKTIKSPADGLAEAITDGGVLKIRTAGKIQDTCSPAPAVIRSINGNINLEIKGEKLIGEDGYGVDRWGLLKIIGQREETLGFQQVGDEVKNSILVVGGSVSNGIYYKIEALEVGGLVCGKMLKEEERLEELTVLELGVEDGFIPENFWKKLQKSQGEKVLLSGRDKFLFIPEN